MEQRQALGGCGLQRVRKQSLSSSCSTRWTSRCASDVLAGVDLCLYCLFVLPSPIFVHTYWFLHVSIHVFSWSSLEIPKYSFSGNSQWNEKKMIIYANGICIATECIYYGNGALCGVQQLAPSFERRPILNAFFSVQDCAQHNRQETCRRSCCFRGK